MFPDKRLRFDVVDSTNDLGKQWALGGIDGSLLITANHQNRGRGRRGAKWLDSPGTSALMSFVVEEPCAIADVWRLSFIAALAARDGCASMSPGEIRLQWPNDIVAEGKKLGGVLVETVAVPQRAWCAVIGIGINVAQSADRTLLDGIQAISLQELTLGAGGDDERLPSEDAGCHDSKHTGSEATFGESARHRPVPSAAKAGSSVTLVELTIAAVSEALARRLTCADSLLGWTDMMMDLKAHIDFGGVQSGIGDDGKVISGAIDDIELATGCAWLRMDDGSRARVRPVSQILNQ